MNSAIAGIAPGSDTELFQSRRLSISQMIRTLAILGLPLVRAHKKGSDGQGKTVQFMLIFERGAKPDLTAEQVADIEKLIGNETDPKVGLDFDVQGFLKAAMPAGPKVVRPMPEHVFLNCGNPHEKTGTATVLEGDTIPRLSTALGSTDMVRVALNVYADKRHLIPAWAEERKRFSQK